MSRRLCFVVASPHSGAGKTSVSLGLMRYFTRLGLQVQAFKCGPDYLDTRLHSLATGRPSINLDLYMSSPDHVRQLFHHYAQAADLCIVEGVMGLFDGAEKSRGSTAELARLLGLPVLLVVEAKAVAYSVAPLLYGFRHFDPSVRTAAVLFNQVNTESHYGFLRDACADVGMAAVGYLPHKAAFRLPETQLGLKLENQADFLAALDRIADALPLTTDLAPFSDWASYTPEPVPTVPKPTTPPNWQISIARDEAFQFVYAENVRALESLGTVRFFSPLSAQSLPPTDLLYFPGGYPERYAEQLSNNTSLLKQIHDYLTQGGHCLAECGGLMYLGESLTDAHGKCWPMVGYLPLRTSMENPRLHLGYREWEYAPGKYIRGHEFHYSSYELTGSLATLGMVRNAKSQPTAAHVYRQGNTIASYLHMYWAHFPESLANMFEAL